MASTASKKKGKAKGSTDEDFEMADADAAAQLKSPWTTPKASKTQGSAPEKRWAEQLDDDLFNFGNSPIRPPKAEVIVIGQDEVDQDDGSPRPPPATPPRALRARTTHLNPTLRGGFIQASGVRRSDQPNLGEAIDWQFHSLEAIRVGTGFIDTHLNDLLWFQDYLIDYHENLVRTRNLVRKVLDGVARSGYTREREDERHTSGEDEGSGE